MECCAHCRESGEFFDRETAEKELRQYRRDGLAKKSARLLVDGLATLDLDDRSLLDVGGGIGAIPFELFEAGVSTATLAEASPGYLEVAEQEAHRRGVAEQMDFRYGDFVEMAPEMPEFDVVTLDRVICCYPHLEKLVEASTSRARRWYGVVYPKPTWFAKTLEGIADLYCRIKGSEFRIYIHDEVDETIRAQGFSPFYEVSTIIWRVALYERDAAAPA